MTDEDTDIPDDGITLECAACGFGEITPVDVEPKGEDQINIHCPECGGKTMRRLSTAVAEPERLQRILGL